MRMIVDMTRRALAALLAVPALIGAAGCSSSAPDDAASIVTSFYPIQFATERITGASDVDVLTKPGAEPHDLEIGPQDLAAMTRARTVIYAKGFQPAVDEAVEQAAPSTVLDVTPAADLMPVDSHNHDPAEGGDHEHGGTDPHFWLDPQRYGAVAKAIGERLAAVDPTNAHTYRANTTTLVAELDRLDAEFRTVLASCHSRELVTSHAAFGYLAERYDLHQHGIAGLSPEAEPSAAALSEITRLVREEGVTTIYQEVLSGPQLAQTVASSTGARIATLDPVEGITTESPGSDYFEVMRANLEALRVGLGCS